MHSMHPNGLYAGGMGHSAAAFSQTLPMDQIYGSIVQNEILMHQAH